MLGVNLIASSATVQQDQSFMILCLCKQPEEKKSFPNEFFLPKGRGGAVAGAVIC